MRWVSATVGGVGYLVSLYYYLKSLLYLSPLGNQHYSWAVDLLAGPKYFTTKGWYYRKLSLLFLFLGFVVGSLLLIVGEA